MAQVYLEEADFDDNDMWFHDGNEETTSDAEVNVEVRRCTVCIVDAFIRVY